MKPVIQRVFTGIGVLLVFGSYDIRDLNADIVVIPDFALAGSRPDRAQLFLNCGNTRNQSPPEKAVYPRQLSLDIYGGHIVGFVAFYSRTTRIMDLVSSVRKAESESKTYPNLEEHGIWIWRNEKQRYAVQVVQSDQEGFGPQITVVWLDRKGPVGEFSVEVTKALTAEALDSVQSDTNDDQD
jgi:hypothetical protein